jgi:ribosomal protein S18 acetylase RimI-like enzyme
MRTIEITKQIIPRSEEILDLYNNVGWSNYTKDPISLIKAFENSTFIIYAWNNDKLVGLLRCVGDGCTIMYIQDILVNTQYQRQGIGMMLMEYFMKEYAHIRQKVLLTDHQSNTIAFYKKCGFTPSEEFRQLAFVHYKAD